jgi:hypothetical protein
MLPNHLTSRIAKTVYAAVSTWNNDCADMQPMAAWDETTPTIREFVEVRVRRILTDARASDSTFHNEWVAEMKEKGWCHDKSYDEKRKTDPLMAPFHLLPYEHQSKERLFRAAVLSLSRI